MSVLVKEVFQLFVVLLGCIALAAKAICSYWKRFFWPKYKDLSNDILFITGAGSGIGRLMSIKFAEKCAKVVLVDISDTGLAETRRLIESSMTTKASCHTYVCDVRSQTAVDDVCAKILKEVGVVTICVNNAGITNGKFLLGVSQAEFENVMRVNLFAHFALMQKFLPNMLGSAFGRYADMASSKGVVCALDKDCELRPPKGHFVCINSMAGTVPAPGLGDYCASKAGAILLSESLREELRSIGLEQSIKVTNIMPYFIDTGMFDGCKRRFGSVLPMQTPEDAARQIVEATLLDREDVYVSERFQLIALIKHILPYQALTHLYDGACSSTMMSTFSGKSKVYLDKK